MQMKNCRGAHAARAVAAVDDFYPGVLAYAHHHTHIYIFFRNCVCCGITLMCTISCRRSSAFRSPVFIPPLIFFPPFFSSPAAVHIQYIYVPIYCACVARYARDQWHGGVSVVCLCMCGTTLRPPLVFLCCVARACAFGSFWCDGARIFSCEREPLAVWRQRCCGGGGRGSW